MVCTPHPDSVGYETKQIRQMKCPHCKKPARGVVRGAWWHYDCLYCGKDGRVNCETGAVTRG